MFGGTFFVSSLFSQKRKGNISILFLLISGRPSSTERFFVLYRKSNVKTSREIRKICVRKTHDKIEHLCPSVQSMGRNSCYSYCFPPYPPIQFTVSFLSEKQCILSRKPAIFHHRRGDGDVYCMVNAPCLVWSMRKVPNDDGGGYGCGME